MGTYNADTPPAFTSDTGYFLQSGTLRGLTISNSTINWSFAGDGYLGGGPIAINQYVFIASNSGNLYALSGSTGQQVWQVALPAPPALQTGDMPMSGLSAGDGLLVVPAGTRLVVYTISANP
jgi:outer membrane protein assembly factor BamB